jgi:serine/threonine-protein kinase
VIGGERIVVRSKLVRVKEQTTTAHHPSAIELAEFALGSLDVERAAVIEGHVYGCDRCAKILAHAPGDDFLKQLQEAHQVANNDGDPGRLTSLQSTVGFALDNAALAELPAGIHDNPRFAIKGLIAEGAMGRVYLATAKNSGEYVAIKVIRPDFANEPRRVERFLQESRIAEKLHHPNIARMIGCESLGSSAMIAMEFVCGRSLAQIVRQRGPLPVGEACEYVRQATDGLAYAATRGVVHRDIKPHNLMFDSQAKLIKIVDFGLGRMVEEQRSGSRLTREDEILGTLDYISPEQSANSRTADARSDIYSLGCTFYFLLAGAPPFSGKNAVQLLRKHELEQPTPIRSLRPDVLPDMATLIDRMMKKDPKLRPQLPEILEVLGRSQTTNIERWSGGDKDSTKRGARGFNSTAMFSALTSPALLLPILTCLVCLIWLTLR